MNVRISPFLARGEVFAPPSKSVAHRLLILAGLKNGKTTVRNIGRSADVIATCNCLRALGAEVVIGDNFATVVGISQVKRGAMLDCNESGSTLRFLLPVAGALGANATFLGSQRLLSRPCGELIDEMERHGVLSNGWSFEGRLEGGEFNIDATVSSQFITGLLLALPILKDDSKINLNGKVVSKDYINITLSTLEKAGVVYQKLGNSIIIKGNQGINLPDEVTVEGDWSGASFPLVLGAINGKVTVRGLDINSCQGDKEILAVLKKAGAEVEIIGDKITVSGERLKAFSHDFDGIPDLAPICAVLAGACEGESVLSGIERLRIKESDRVLTTVQMLSGAGIFAEERDGKIAVRGGKADGCTFDGANDHRIVMSSAVLGSVAGGESVIIGSEAVRKSYPEFFEDFITLGGSIDVTV